MRRLLPLLLLLILSVGPAALAQPFAEGEQERVFDALVEVFERNYWDEDYLDWQEWAAPYREAALQAGTRATFDQVIGRMVGSLGDQHSSWLGLAYYRSGQGGEAEPGRPQPRLGISGRLLRGTGVVIERVYPASPADRAGIRRGDVLVAVGGHDLTGAVPPGREWQWLSDASRRERVEVEIKRGRARFTAVIEPAPYALYDALELPQAQMLDERLGYLYIPSFNRGDVASNVHRLLAELRAEGMRELILDLRGNPGGLLTELGLTLGAFVDGTWARAVSRGEVIWYAGYEVEDARGRTWLAEPGGEAILGGYVEEPVSFDGPLVVLVDEGNSSAGELAALVLQNRGRARVIGEPTAGNVEAVQGFDLPDGSVVMVAVANVEGPEGTDFSAGVVPDRRAHSDLRELARGFDAPVDEAVRMLRGLPFTPNRFFGKTEPGQGAGG